MRTADRFSVYRGAVLYGVAEWGGGRGGRSGGVGGGEEGVGVGGLGWWWLFQWWRDTIGRIFEASLANTKFRLNTVLSETLFKKN